MQPVKNGKESFGRNVERLVCMSLYSDWVENNVKEAYGRCKEYVEKMHTTFPELSVRRGFYHCPFWGERQHWWLEDEDGQVVDPTAVQFPSKGAGEYESLNDDELEDKVPTGVCMDCGAPVYHGVMFCSERCEMATLNYLNTGRL